MKIGLISDIHSNLRGLEKALKLLEDCEEVLCAGDLLSLYRFSGEVLHLLRDRQIRAIVGNHDKTILYSPEHPLRSSPSVRSTDLEYLARLPETLTLDVNGVRIAMFHGAPWDEEGTTVAYYVYPDVSRDIHRVRSYESDVIVLGHTHQSFCERGKGEATVVNPGSCGESRDPSGLFTCAMLDTATGHVEFRHFSV